MTREQIRELAKVHPHQWIHELGMTPLQWLLNREEGTHLAIRTQIAVASAIVHADEYFDSVEPNELDKQAFKSLIKSPDVRHWLVVLDGMAFLPVRRDGVDYR